MHRDRPARNEIISSQIPCPIDKSIPGFMLALGQSSENVQTTDHPLLDYFERIEIIDLVDRTDRRQEMLAQLKRIDLSLLPGRVEFFPAQRPATRGDWPSVGARGCFLSHYEVLRRARDEGLRNIVVLEDDCDFAPEFAQQQRRLTQALSKTAWDILYLGHREQVGINGSDRALGLDPSAHDSPRLCCQRGRSSSTGQASGASDASPEWASGRWEAALRRSLIDISGPERGYQNCYSGAQCRYATQFAQRYR